MIAIVVDSTVYMTRDEARALGATVVPITYTVADMPYNETYTDQNGEFERLLLTHGKCQTSQTSIATFMSTFSELLEQDCDILCLTLSSRLSGTYSSASIAAREIGRRRIVVFDSLTTAGGLYLLVKHARMLINAGTALEDLSRELMKVRSRINIVFSVDDMTPLRNSGRLGFVRQSVGTVLNIRPLLRCAEGAVTSMGVVRGRHEQVRQLAASIQGHPRYIILHSLGDPRPARLLQEEIARLHPDSVVEHRPLGPVLCIHLGMGVIGAAWMDD